MAHSKGKWNLRGNKIFIDDTYKSVATIHVQENYEQITFKPIKDVEATANAKLIAAAPALLEALDDLRFLVGITPEINKQKAYVDCIQKAEQAIKKATE